MGHFGVGNRVLFHVAMDLHVRYDILVCANFDPIAKHATSSRSCDEICLSINLLPNYRDAMLGYKYSVRFLCFEVNHEIHRFFFDLKKRFLCLSECFSSVVVFVSCLPMYSGDATDSTLGTSVIGSLSVALPCTQGFLSSVVFFIQNPNARLQYWAVFTGMVDDAVLDDTDQVGTKQQSLGEPHFGVQPDTGAGILSKRDSMKHRSSRLDIVKLKQGIELNERLKLSKQSVCLFICSMRLSISTVEVIYGMWTLPTAYIVFLQQFTLKIL